MAANGDDGSISEHGISKDTGLNDAARTRGGIMNIPEPEPVIVDPSHVQLPQQFDIDRSASLRRLANTGMLELPVAASTQEFEAGMAPAPEDVALPEATVVEVGAKEVVATGTLPEPRAKATKAAKKGPQNREYVTDDHKLTLTQLQRRYETHIDPSQPAKSKGLTAEEAARRLKAYGPNQLSPPKELPEIIKFLKQFTNLLMVLLIVAAALAFLAYGLNVSDSSNVILAGTLCVLVVLTCSMNYYHERQTGNVMASIRGMLPSLCTVIRDGHETKIQASQLVIGDLVHLTIGNRIPADIRLIEVNELKVECSSLTGESDAIECSVERRSEIPVESRNIVFNSSLVMNGDARGIVYRTGDDTMIGSIAGLASTTHTTRSSMEIEIAHVVRFISGFAVVTAVILFAIGLGRGLGIVTAIVYGFILVLVANVPEGLPTTVVTVLTLTAQRMAEHHIFIKRTDIIETLGSATVIASDKTGTLTMNKMTVENIWCNRSYSVASKVKHTAAGPRRVDHTANMTVGRQMSVLKDGTMVIHSQTRRPAMDFSTATAPPPETLSPESGAKLEGGPGASPGPIMAVPADAPPASPAKGPAASPPPPNPLAHAVSAPIADAISHGHLAPILESKRAAAAPRPHVAESKVQTARSRNDSFAVQGSYRSFNSFQGMTGASWQRSNPFTRLVTTAAVCNRAQFSYGDDDDEPKPTSASPGDADARRNPQNRDQPPATSHRARSAAKKKKATPVTVSGDQRKVLGDASEAALLRYCDSLVPIFEFRMAYPVIFEVPFNSVNKWALSIAKDPEDHLQHLVFMKGAPERILERCSHYLYNGLERPIDNDFRVDHQGAYERFGMMGERVLGFAYQSFKGRDPSVYKANDKAYPTSGLVFVGLISLVDPPKDGVEEAIGICRDAFIRVTMVTGDHPLTAEAIARKVGIITQPTAREIAAEEGIDEAAIALEDPRVRAVVMGGYALPSLTEKQWDILLGKDEVVFARTSPQQKLQIVEHYQRLGHVVAVTGDGTNDSPALKKAQIGVSMGSANASDVAREAADIILLDDNFASIVQAIEMGRLVYDNLKKTIAYTLTHAVPELVPVFLALALGAPLALPGLLILTIDLITEQGPAISLSYEPAESSIMTRPPRNMKTDRLVDWRLIRYSYGIVGVLETLTCCLAFFTVFNYYGIPGSSVIFSEQYWAVGSPNLVVDGNTFTDSDQVHIAYEAHSAYYLTLVLCQAWHVFMCKVRSVPIGQHGALRNHVTAYGIMVAIFTAFFFIYIDAVQSLFQTAYLGGYWFLPNIAFGITIYCYTEYSRYLARQNPTGWWACHMQW